MTNAQPLQAFQIALAQITENIDAPLHHYTALITAVEQLDHPEISDARTVSHENHRVFKALCQQLCDALVTRWQHTDSGMDTASFFQLLAIKAKLEFIFALTTHKHTDHLFQSLHGAYSAQHNNHHRRRLALFCFSSAESQVHRLERFATILPVETFALALAALGLEGHYDFWLLNRQPDILAFLQRFPPDVLCGFNDVIHNYWMRAWITSCFTGSPHGATLRRLISTWLQQRLRNDQTLQNRLQVSQPSQRSKPRLVLIAEGAIEGKASMQQFLLPLFPQLAVKFELIFLTPCPLAGRLVQYFKQVIVYQDQSLVDIVSQLQRLQPDMIYYLGIGCHPKTVMMAHLRLAPFQVTHINLAVPTQIPTIDYLILEEQLIGKRHASDEPFLALPNGALPWCCLAKTQPPLHYEPRISAQHIHIAVVVRYSKLSSDFLAALDAIAQQSQRTVHYTFFISCCATTMHLIADDLYHRFASVTVHGKLPYEDYQQALHRCAFLLSPWPYGNGLSTMEATYAGVPTLALIGDAMCNRIASSILIHFPHNKLLLQSTIDGYIKQAVNFCDDTELLTRIAEDIRAMSRTAPTIVEPYSQPSQTLLSDALLALMRADLTTVDGISYPNRH